MPRKFYRRRHRKSKVFRKRKSFAAKVNRIVNKKREHKWFNIVLNPDPIDFNGEFLDLSTVAQGVQQNQRIGYTIQYTSYTMRYSVLLADTTNIVRVIIFKWKSDDNADPPSVAKILYDGPGVASSVYSSYNPDSRDQFTIVMDKMHKLNANNDNALVIKKNKKLKGEIKFNGTGTTGTDKLYMLLISDSSIDNHPTMIGDFTLRYMDS